LRIRVALASRGIAWRADTAAAFSPGDADGEAMVAFSSRRRST